MTHNPTQMIGLVNPSENAVARTVETFRLEEAGIVQVAFADTLNEDPVWSYTFGCEDMVSIILNRMRRTETPAILIRRMPVELSKTALLAIARRLEKKAKGQYKKFRDNVRNFQVALENSHLSVVQVHDYLFGHSIYKDTNRFYFVHSLGDMSDEELLGIDRNMVAGDIIEGMLMQDIHKMMVLWSTPPA